MKHWKKWLGLTALSALLVTGCANAFSAPANDGSANHKLKIVTTFYPMYDFAKHVAGDQADVTVLVPAGIEPHDWEPTPQDLIKIQQADLFVYNGAGLEEWVDKALQSLKTNKLKVVEATQGLNLMEGNAEDNDPHEESNKGAHEEHALDPHVWLDPVMAQQQVQAIEKALVELDPAHQTDYVNNTNAYLTQLQSLDQSFRDLAATAKQKEFVTQHAAFGYLAKRYGFDQISISGLNPEVEPSTAQMADVVNLAKQRHVKVIYFESLVSPKVAQMVAKEVGCETAVLNPLEGLSEAEQAQNLDYIGVMERNLTELKKSFL